MTHMEKTPAKDNAPIEGRKLFGVPLKIAGEPIKLEEGYAVAGEDFVNNRLLVTIIDWARMVNGGWRTKPDQTDVELKEVADAINKYLSDRKNV